MAIMTGDPTDPTGDMFNIYTRLGKKDLVTEEWTWSWWRAMNDWRNIDNRPKYFHARWDYLEDPNNLLNHINSMSGTGDNPSDETIIPGEVSAVHHITKEEIDALLNSVTEVNSDLEETVNHHSYGTTATNTDFEYSEPINYQVPQFLVGLSEYNASMDGKNYIIDVELPTAQDSELTAAKPKRRRKVRFLLSGSNNIINAGIRSIQLMVHYVDNAGQYYSYTRNWGAEFISGTSLIDVEFEQADMPGGKRLWCPIEIG